MVTKFPVTVLVATGPGLSGGETAVEGVENEPDTTDWEGCRLVVLDDAEGLVEGIGAPLAVGWAMEVALPVGKGAEGMDFVIEAAEGAADDVVTVEVIGEEVG